MGEYTLKYVIVSTYRFDMRKNDPIAKKLYPKIVKFMKDNPLVKEIRGLANGETTFVFAYDGSKECWGLSNKANKQREKFIKLFQQDDMASIYKIEHPWYNEKPNIIEIETLI